MDIIIVRHRHFKRCTYEYLQILDQKQRKYLVLVERTHKFTHVTLIKWKFSRVHNQYTRGCCVRNQFPVIISSHDDEFIYSAVVIIIIIIRYYCCLWFRAWEDERSLEPIIYYDVSYLYLGICYLMFGSGTLFYSMPRVLMSSASVMRTWCTYRSRYILVMHHRQ